MKKQAWKIIFETIEEFQWTTPDRDMILSTYYQSDTPESMTDLMRAEYKAEGLAWDWGIGTEVSRFCQSVYQKIDQV